ncbi:general substrate transporter [Ilyonectria destructans]|nr:general substrate transporter [Ilyonectria destructans]
MSVTTYDGGMINSLNVVVPYATHFKLDPSLMGLNAALVSAGCVATGPFTGLIIDKWGRRNGLALGCIAALVGVILQASATVEAQFAVGRFFLGIATAINTATAPIWVMELGSPTNRALLVGITIGLIPLAGALVGGIVLATYNLGNNWAWRIPVLGEAAGPLISLVLLLFVDESPRFYVSKGRKEEALEILTRLHCDGNTTNPIVQAEFKEICDTLEFEKVHMGGWASLVQPAGNLRRFIIAVLTNIFFQISGPNTVLYFLTLVLVNAGIVETQTVLLITLGILLWNSLWLMIGAFIIHRYGRKKTFIYGTCFITLCFALLAGLVAGAEKTGKMGYSIGAIVVIVLFQVAADCSWMIMGYSYPAEVLCYQQRAKGTAISQAIGYAFSFLNLYTTPIALKKISWRLYAANAGWNIPIIVIIAYFFVETKGLTLEEIDSIFEGQDPTIGEEKDEKPSAKDVKEVKG